MTMCVNGGGATAQLVGAPSLNRTCCGLEGVLRSHRQRQPFDAKEWSYKYVSVRIIYLRN